MPHPGEQLPVSPDGSQPGVEVANRRRGVLSSTSQSVPSLSGDRRAVSISWLLATGILRQTRLQQRLRVRRVGGSKTAHGDPADPLAQQAGRAKLRIDRRQCAAECATSGRKALLRLPPPAA